MYNSFQGPIVGLYGMSLVLIFSRRLDEELLRSGPYTKVAYTNLSTTICKNKPF